MPARRCAHPETCRIHGPERWVVLDHDGDPLPGSWATEQEAVDEGLCKRYLLSGFEVVVEQ